MGPLSGERLRWLPSEVTTWKKWKEAHPETTVLKPPFPSEHYRGINRSYDRYRATDELMFPKGPPRIDPKYPKKSAVTILRRPDGHRCYPHALLKEGRNADGALVVVKDGASVRVLDARGAELPTMTGFWFAWCQFYPDGTVYEPPDE